MASVWTPELHEVVAEAWLKGESGATIAARLSHERHIKLTSNSVICRMHRHGILQGNVVRPPRPAYARPSRAKGTTAAKVSAAVVPPRPKAAPAPAPRVAVPARLPARFACTVPAHSGTVRFMDTKMGQCRWISGEPTADALCCGEPVRPGASYCPGHCALAYVPSRARPLVDQVTNFLNPLGR